MWSIVVLLGIAAAVGLFGVGIYNGLVASRNLYKNAYAQIDVQLRRRHDLIPNLVETAKGYIKHERETLETVTAARNRAVDANRAASANPGDPQVMRGVMEAELGLNGALGRLFAVAEAYPDLKANQSMNRLMEELTATENSLAFARQAFNDAVAVYNIRRESFPNVLVANQFGFVGAQMLEPIEAPADREPPKIQF